MRNRMMLALALAGLVVGPALAQDADEVEAGEKIFKRCAACHQVGPDAKNRVGPELNGIIGRTAGGLEGFNYSKAMTEAGAGGLVWSEETLMTYLEDPKGMVKGTKMAFAGLKSEEDRHAVIEYLEAEGGSSYVEVEPEDFRRPRKLLLGGGEPEPSPPAPRSPASGPPTLDVATADDYDLRGRRCRETGGPRTAAR